MLNLLGMIMIGALIMVVIVVCVWAIVFISFDIKEMIIKQPRRYWP